MVDNPIMTEHWLFYAASTEVHSEGMGINHGTSLLATQGQVTTFMESSRYGVSIGV